MTTPADEIRDAATKVRELASASTEGPWVRWRDQEGIPGWDGFIVIGDDAAEGEDCNPTARVYVEQDAAYIAAMHPAVGLAIADWLDETARNAEPFGPINARAVEAARAINATAPAAGEQPHA